MRTVIGRGKDADSIVAPHHEAKRTKDGGAGLNRGTRPWGRAFAQWWRGLCADALFSAFHHDSTGSAIDLPDSARREFDPFGLGERNGWLAGAWLAELEIKSMRALKVAEDRHNPKAKSLSNQRLFSARPTRCAHPPAMAPFRPPSSCKAGGALSEDDHTTRNPRHHDNSPWRPEPIPARGALNQGDATAPDWRHSEMKEATTSSSSCCAAGRAGRRVARSRTGRRGVVDDVCWLVSPPLGTAGRSKQASSLLAWRFTGWRDLGLRCETPPAGHRPLARRQPWRCYRLSSCFERPPHTAQAQAHTIPGAHRDA